MIRLPFAVANLALLVLLATAAPVRAQDASAAAQGKGPNSLPATGASQDQSSSRLPNAGFATGQAVQVSTPSAGTLFASPFANQHLFGSWGGARPWLSDHGIEVDLNWLTENAGNVSGGRRGGFDFAGQVGLEVDLDLEKMLGWKGAAFHTMTVNGNGRSLSADYLGDGLAAVQQIYGGRGNVVAHLVYAYGEQSLFKGRLNLTGGWLPVGSFFAASPLYCRFMNVLFCGNPHPLPNYPGEMDWPQASFGGIVRGWIRPNLYAMVGLFSVDADFGTGGGGISGWSWADPHKSGVSIPVELGYIPSFGRDKLIGHYKLGYDHDTHRYADVTNSLRSGDPISHPRDMWYVLADQMLVRQGPGLTDGLILFGGWVHGSDDVSPLTQQVFVGLTGSGTPWGRKGDTVGLSWHMIEMSGAYTKAQEAAALGGSAFPLTLDGFGPAYGPQNTEQVIEANYTVAIVDGVTIMPDVQYVIRPGASTATPNAAVLGFRTNVTF